MWTLPNVLTITRIALAPVIALLPFIGGYWPKVIAFVAFLAAAASDIADGYFARSRKQVTDLGILLDPIADKLLLVATLVYINERYLSPDEGEVRVNIHRQTQKIADIDPRMSEKSTGGSCS